MKSLVQFSILAAISLAFVACGGGEKTPMQYMPHMANTPVLKSQEGYDAHGTGASMLLPPEHTIARGFRPYRIATAEEAEKKLKNPLPRTMEVLKRGQNRYNIYCKVCHGDRGYGDGPVVPPFPAPKSLQSKAMRDWKDGRLFHVITKGQGIMSPYATQVPPEDRWAIIHFIRVLQRAEHPSEADLNASIEE